MSKVLNGGLGKSMSIAELILARNKHKKPSVKVVDPIPSNVPVAPISTTAEEKQVEESLIGSERHREMIFKEGEENARYYLQKQKEDGNRLPWFRYVKKESQYSEFVTLNTQMAQELLDHIWTEGEGNRKLKTWLKDAYKRDIIENRWIPSDESIGIDYKGVVYNGRHRTTALVESGKSWPFYMTFQCLEEAKFTVDSGAKRNAADKLKIVLNTKLANRTTGFCKSLMKGTTGKIRYTETEVAEFASKWSEIINWVHENLPLARAEVQAVVAKAYLWYGPEKIGPFCERLREVRFTEDGDPARALFMALQRSKINRINIPLTAYKKTLSAVEALMNNKEITRLFERDEDIFQWQQGWELPKGSWWEKNRS